MRIFYVVCCLLLLPLASWAQTPSTFQLNTVFGTPLENPQDVAAAAHRYIYILDDGLVTQLDAEGRFVAQLDPKSPNANKAKLANIRAIGADAAGNLYVADRGAREVRKFSPSGQLLLTFTHPHWVSDEYAYRDNYPISLTVDAAGNVYALEYTRTLKFNTQAQLQWVYDPRDYWTTGGVFGISGGRDIAINSQGLVFCLDYGHTVTVLDAATGKKQRSFSVKDQSYTDSAHPSLAVDAAGNVYTLNGIAISKSDSNGVYQNLLRLSVEAETYALTFDQEDNLYVTTARATNRYDYTGGSRLFKLNTAGQQLAQWGNQTSQNCLTQDKLGNYYVYEALQRQLRKYDAAGQEINRFPEAGAAKQFSINDRMLTLATDISDNVYALYFDYDAQKVAINKFNAQGRYITTIPIPISNDYMWPASLAISPAGDLYITNGFEGLVYKFDSSGRQLLRFGAKGRGAGQLEFPMALAVDIRGYVYVADINGHRLQKFTSDGRFLRETKNLSAIDDTYPRCTVGLSVDAKGTAFLGSTLDAFVQVYGPDGQPGQRIPGMFCYPSVNLKGTRLLALNKDRDAVHLFMAPSPTAVTEALISGRVFQDQTFTCASQTAPGMKGMLVVAEPGNYYGLTDENGTYTMAVDTGTYTVRQLVPTEPGRQIQVTCATTQKVRVGAYNTTVAGPDFGNFVSATPHLTVNVASNRRRRCFRNLTTVSYGNSGFAAANNAKVLVELPEHVVLVAANAPYTRTAKGYYQFEVGTLTPNQHGTILIQDSVACGNSAIRGLTVCTKAWITPANTYSGSPSWNAASITVSGTGEASNQARFTVTNTGKAATTDSLSLRVYQDAQLALVHRYSLAAADSLVLRVPATGRVVRVEADQPQGHPLKTMASANVELANRVTDGVPSASMQAFPLDDTEPEKAVDCQPIVDSFDPNDKQVAPVGLTAEHYTPTNTPLRYQLRFQNTGTDVAYRVEVVDTLAADLDVSTLKLESSSHPYRLNVSGKNRPVLTFTFDNIMLPDSTRDVLGSNGFVQFSVKPKAGLAPKTRIENVADIIFDYNEPVRTNTTVNRIFDVPPTVNPAIQLQPQQVIVTPSILSFSPVQGRVGTLVTLTGKHFSPTPASNRVLFQGVAAPVLSATSTSLTVRVPANAATAPIQLLTPEGATKSAGIFTFIPAPVLTSFSPSVGKPGSSVIITGRNFRAGGATDTVYFQGTAATVLNASAERLEVLVPEGARSGPITVSGAGGTVQSATAFTVSVLTPTTTADAFSAIQVYPNPTAGLFTIDWQKADVAVQQVRVFNAVGSLVFQENMRRNSPAALTVNLATNQPGLYVVVLQTATGTITKRVTLH
ncbi:hypothetical protein GCM10027346_00190 [Hymenobacter seoulensis]